MKFYILIKSILIIFVIFSPQTIFADENKALIREANDLYSKGEYSHAAVLYDSVINSGFESPDLYYNLGNTYYKQNLNTKAIINYERALLLAPEDEDIKYNLALANNQVLDNINELPILFISTWMNKLTNIFSTNMWAIISIITFVSCLFLLLFFVFSNRRIIKKLCFWFAVFCLIISFFSFLFTKIQKDNLLFRDSAIITSPSVTLKSSPDESGTDLFLLHEGTKVHLIDSLGEWREIKLADGNIAWLKYSDIVII